MINLFPCPCCGNRTLEDIGEFDVCKVCMWEDDPLQRDNPDDDMGANTMSLNEARVIWVARNVSPPAYEATPHAV